MLYEVITISDELPGTVVRHIASPGDPLYGAQISEIGGGKTEEEARGGWKRVKKILSDIF